MSAEVKKTKGTPDPVDIHVGQRLRVRRSLLGLSQEKLAESIGLTFQQIQKYERGLNRISAGRLYKFSQILQVPITYFFEKIGHEEGALKPAMGMSDKDQDPIVSDDMMNSKETLDLVRAYYAIQDENIRDDIFKFIKSMAENLPRK